MTPPLDLRASDADRDGTVFALRSHAAEGRLELAELEERLEAAFAARTHGELAALTSDLPRRESRPRPGPRAPELRPYLAVMALLIAIWVVTGAGYFWPLWPMLGWGVPLIRRRGGGLGSRRHELAHLRPGSS